MFELIDGEKQMRFIIKQMRDDCRLQREFGVIDTVEDVIVIHTNSRNRAEEMADDLNEEMKYSWH